MKPKKFSHSPFGLFISAIAQRYLSFLVGAFALAGISNSALADTISNPTAEDLAIPRYDHIFVIIEENQAQRRIIGSADAPNINSLANKYGNATNFYSDVHPSEGNYVAILGGT